MKVLITGGAGFLGLHLSKYLHSKGHNIVLLDIAPYEKHDYPDSKINFIGGDVRDPDKVDLALSGVDAVIHGAAALPLWTEDEIYSTNVFGTHNVLERAMKAKIDRFIFVSSTSVYGVPKVHPLYEYFPRVGVGAYGESKILAEKVCEEYRKKGMTVGIIRPKTFIGPYRLGVFQILYNWIEEGHKIPLIGDGTNHYQLMDVVDLARAFELIITNSDQQVVSDTYNTGAETFGTVFEDMIDLCEHAGSGATPLPLPATPIIAVLSALEKAKLSPLYKWVYGTAHTDSFVSIQKIKEQLGWQPEYSNADALIRSYDWYIDNKQSISNETGVTHRVAWDQGILKLFKKFI